ncbi:hypothetical protein LTR04_006459 [Oleoguttula sp. CCFEE 6159]|nr:hypothetical protein LTR04_006459 [Oleoguttula sp. CCFEE 6159]
MMESNDLMGKDKAALLLAEADHTVTITAADHARVLRKIDLTILPVLLTVYCLQYLDKATLSYASVFGLIKDAHLRGQDYSWLGSIVYVAQLVMQPLIAYSLVKLPIGKFVATMVLSWGITLCCMVAATNFGGLMAARFVLGALEASVAPAFIAITQMWWRRIEQTNRVAAWYSMLGVVNMVVVLARVYLFVLPDSPMEARFLKGDDKLIAIERLKANQMGVASRVWKWDHLKESFLDIKTWFWFAMIFSVSIPSSGISTFGPLIIQSFGYDSFKTILFNIPFGAVQLVATLGGAYLATHWKRKGPVLLLLCVPPIIGCVILVATDHTASHRGVLLFGYYIISFYPGISPLIYSWSSQNTAGDTKRKCTTAFLFVGQSAGNIVGPHLYTPSEAPRYLRGLVSNLVMFLVIILLVVLTTLYLMFLNKRHAKRRVQVGKSAEIVDQSMMDKKTWNKSEGGAHSGNNGQQLFEKAFDDETDLKNEDFIFVY